MTGFGVTTQQRFLWIPGHMSPPRTAILTRWEQRPKCILTARKSSDFQPYLHQAGTYSPPATETLDIGNVNFSGNRTMEGAIDDARIYDRVLSAAEIAELVDTGTGGLVAHYRLDETTGTTVTDSSIYRNDGTMQNGLDAFNDRIDGPMDIALNFDGVDDAISLGNTPTYFPNDNAWTVTTWLKPSSIAAGALNDRIISPRRDATSASAFILGVEADKLLFWYHDGTTSNTTTHGFINTNQWYHAAVSYNGSDYKIYIDGVETSSITNTFSGFGTGPVNLGAHIAGGGDSYHGALDDTRIYDRALTDAEILAIYNAGDPPAQPNDGLIGHWKLDETAGTTAADSSGNGNDATMINGLSGATDSNCTAKLDTAMEFNMYQMTANQSSRLPLMLQPLAA